MTKKMVLGVDIIVGTDVLNSFDPACIVRKMSARWQSEKLS